MVDSLNEYQELAKRTAGKNVLNDPVYTALGLNEEAGEYAGVVKHEVYHKHPPDREKKLKELGDVLWYLAMSAACQGFTLSQVATANVDKLLARYPNGFSTEASIARADGEKMSR